MLMREFCELLWMWTFTHSVRSHASIWMVLIRGLTWILSSDSIWLNQICSVNCFVCRFYAANWINYMKNIFKICSFVWRATSQKKNVLNFQLLPVPNIRTHFNNSVWQRAHQKPNDLEWGKVNGTQQHHHISISIGIAADSEYNFFFFLFSHTSVSLFVAISNVAHVERKTSTQKCSRCCLSLLWIFSPYIFIRSILSIFFFLLRCRWYSLKSKKWRATREKKSVYRVRRTRLQAIFQQFVIGICLCA